MPIRYLRDSQHSMKLMQISFVEVETAAWLCGLLVRAIWNIAGDGRSTNKIQLLSTFRAGRIWKQIVLDRHIIRMQTRTPIRNTLTSTRIRLAGYKLMCINFTILAFLNEFDIPRGIELACALIRQKSRWPVNSATFADIEASQRTLTNSIAGRVTNPDSSRSELFHGTPATISLMFLI